MPSAPIVHRDARSRSGRNALRSLVALLVASLVLTACGTGDVDESRMYAEREATKQAQVPIMQATTTARFFSGTPVPEPSATPWPVLAELTLASSVGGNNAPQNRIRNASGSGTVFAAARIHDLTAGTNFTAVWGRADGTEIARDEQTPGQSAENGWVAFSWPVNGSQPGGEYAVFIYAEGTLIGSLVFTMS